MFEQSFKNIDNELHKDAGCSTEMDYIEQTSWLLFLKYLEDLENNRAMEAELNGKKYTPIIDENYTWSSWAYPKTADGKLDYHKAMTGDDLVNFVRDKLWPYLAHFKELADAADTLEYKIGVIFSELRNKINDGYILRTVINIMQEMRFQTSEEKHELSELYEGKIKIWVTAGATAVNIIPQDHSSELLSMLFNQNWATKFMTALAGPPASWWKLLIILRKASN